MENLAQLLNLLMDELKGLLGLGVKPLMQMTADLLQLPQRTVMLIIENVREAGFCMGTYMAKTLQEPVRRILGKLSRVPHLFRDALGFVLLKLDEVLPPKTRAEALRALSRWAPRVLLAALVLVCLYYLFHLVCSVLVGCCRCVIGSVTYAVSFADAASVLLLTLVSKCCGLVYGVCCVCARGIGITMMKVPGAGGLLIPRSLFEISPRLFFVGARTAKRLLGFCTSKPGLVTCLGGFVAWVGFKLLSGIVKLLRPARR